MKQNYHFGLDMMQMVAKLSSSHEGSAFPSRFSHLLTESDHPECRHLSVLKSSVMALPGWKVAFTECLEEVLPPLHPNPTISGIWVYHRMVNLNTFSVGLLVASEILQPLPRACPWQASDDDIIDTGGAAGRNVRHRETVVGTILLHV